jgi:hypothetical protein
MKTRLLATLSACAVLASAGCVRQAVQQREDLLSAAGFRVQPANTPERRASLRALPEHRLVREEMNGRGVWVYADPLVCNCLYVGTEEDYQRYNRLKVERDIASDRLMAAQLRSRLWGIGPYGWGAWGPWGF